MSSLEETSSSSSPSPLSPGHPESDFERRFHAHVHKCTALNWKYWVFARVVAASCLMPTFQVMRWKTLFYYDVEYRRCFQAAVKTSSPEAFARSAKAWQDQHCAASALRPGVARALRDLALEADLVEGTRGLPQLAIARAADAEAMIVNNAVKAESMEF